MLTVFHDIATSTAPHALAMMLGVGMRLWQGGRGGGAAPDPLAIKDRAGNVIDDRAGNDILSRV